MAPDLTPDLSCYWEGARELCEDNEWDEERKCCKSMSLLQTPPLSVSGIFYLYASILLLTDHLFLVQ